MNEQRPWKCARAGDSWGVVERPAAIAAGVIAIKLIIHASDSTTCDIVWPHSLDQRNIQIGQIECIVGRSSG